MKRFLILPSMVAFLLGGAGCNQAPVDQGVNQGSEAQATRGKHRVRNSSRGASSKSTQTADVDIPILNVAQLDLVATDFEVDRDPFRYGKPKREKPKPPKPKPPKTEPRPEPEPRETGPVKPTPPPFPHTYIGSFGPASLRIAVFEDREGTIINAAEGEVLEDKFKVLKIGFESVDIEFVGFPDAPAERLQIGG